MINNVLKRIPKGNGMLFISFVAISLCFIIIASSVHTKKYNDMSSNDMYTGHEISFSIFESAKDDIWDRIIPDLSAACEDFAIYLPLEESEFVLRGTYINGTVLNPPMIWGEFFDKETSLTDKPSMVIGVNHEKDIQYTGDKAYYSYYGTSYEVLGVMGMNTESRINDMIFMDFNSALNLNGVNAQYCLDTKEKEDIKYVGIELEQELSGKTDSMVILPGDIDEGLISSFISRGIIMDVLYIMIVICFVLCTVLVTKMWLEFRDKLFIAFRLCGYSKRIIALEIFKRYYLVTIISYIASVLIALIISACINDISIFVSDVIVSFVLSASLGIVILAATMATGARRSALR
ncbi:MAG: hypothetical protein E7265_10795 [Lachnospiraceae bacterium]|nr:hypothetical protein [Lachnospiraceae bacterium]